MSYLSSLSRKEHQQQQEYRINDDHSRYLQTIKMMTHCRAFSNYCLNSSRGMTRRTTSHSVMIMSLARRRRRVMEIIYWFMMMIIVFLNTPSVTTTAFVITNNNDVTQIMMTPMKKIKHNNENSQRQPFHIVPGIASSSSHTSLLMTATWYSNVNTGSYNHHDDNVPNFQSNDPYIVFGISSSLPQSILQTKEIKKIFKRLALQYHPDMITTTHSTSYEKKLASDRFAKINWAYEILLKASLSNEKMKEKNTSTVSTNKNYRKAKPVQPDEPTTFRRYARPTNAKRPQQQNVNTASAVEENNNNKKVDETTTVNQDSNNNYYDPYEKHAGKKVNDDYYYAQYDEKSNAFDKVFNDFIKNDGEVIKDTHEKPTGPRSNRFQYQTSKATRIYDDIRREESISNSNNYSPNKKSTTVRSRCANTGTRFHKKSDIDSSSSNGNQSSDNSSSSSANCATSTTITTSSSNHHEKDTATTTAFASTDTKNDIEDTKNDDMEEINTNAYSYYYSSTGVEEIMMSSTIDEGIEEIMTISDSFPFFSNGSLAPPVCYC